MILLIDNYDSFVYNLYQYIGEINPNLIVKRNDEITIKEIRELSPSHIILSPGPGHPKNSNICLDIVRELGSEYPILGVCLGHQAIAYVYDSEITYAKELKHGKQDDVSIIKQDQLFKGVNNLKAARYHSLVVSENISNQLEVLAQTKDNEIMAIKHSLYNVYGLQFHPESILTNYGMTILKNFLEVSNGN